MIDCENEVYTAVATAVRSEFPEVNISGVYVNAPSSFPHVSFTQSDSSVISRMTTDTDEMDQIMFEVNVYSNDIRNKKSECKNIMKCIDDVMFSMNFTRSALTPVPNMENATIYRLVARYHAVTDGTFFYRG